MRLTLNLVDVLYEMGNEYGEDFEELGLDFGEIADKLIVGQIAYNLAPMIYKIAKRVAWMVKV